MLCFYATDQGARGSFWDLEMPFDEPEVSPVALDAEWGPGLHHANGLDGILPLAVNRSGYQNLGVSSAYGGTTWNALGLVFIMPVTEPLSDLDPGRISKISKTILEKSRYILNRPIRARKTKRLRF